LMPSLRRPASCVMLTAMQTPPATWRRRPALATAALKHQLGGGTARRRSGAGDRRQRRARSAHDAVVIARAACSRPSPRHRRRTATAATGGHPRLRQRVMGSPVLASQTRAVWSWLAVTRHSA
jgi:hypothetical protein